MSRRAALGAGAGLMLGVLKPDIARAFPQPASTRQEPARARRGEWALPAHDLSATRHGERLDGTRIRWNQSLEGGVASASAIVRGCVYAASVGGAVGAYDLRTGRERWLRRLGVATYGSGEQARQLGFFGGVAAAGRRVVVASDRVFCLDAARGRTLWSSAPLRTATSDDYFWGPPVIAGDLVLVGSGSGSELPTARGRLSAYSLRHGTPVWSTPMVPEGGNGGGVIGPSTVDVRAGVAYVATGSPYEPTAGDNPGTCSLVELRMRDGAVIWTDQVYAGDAHGFDFNSAPVVLGRLVVAANKDGFYAWDRCERRRLWHRRITPSLSDGERAGPVDGPEGGPVATDGTRVYVLSNDAATGTCVAAALGRDRGDVLWQRALPSFSFAAPALAGGQLCVTGADGAVRVLARRDGLLLDEIALGEPSASAPAAADGRLIVGTGAEPFLPGHSVVCIG